MERKTKKKILLYTGTGSIMLIGAFINLLIFGSGYASSYCIGLLMANLMFIFEEWGLKK